MAVDYKQVMSDSFRAAVLRQAGLARPYADTKPLRIEQVTALEPGPEEALVKVMAASLCRSDLSVVDGARAWPMPIVLGHEASGIVEKVGSSGSSVRPGDHVVLVFQAQCGTCASCIAGDAHLCQQGLASNQLGELLAGGTRLQSNGSALHHHMGLSAFAEYAVVSQHSLVVLPNDVPFDVGALFGCAAMCGAGTVLNTAGVAEGDTVAVVGSGGIGSSALLGAQVAGAEQIIAVDTDKGRLDFALSLGATDTVLVAKEPNKDPTGSQAREAAAEVLELSKGGVDYAFETAGKIAAFETAYSSTRRGGTIVTLGLVDPMTPFSLGIADLVTSAKTIKGSYIGSCNPVRDIPRFIETFQAGGFAIDQLITHRLGLDEINTALDRMVNKEALRQVVFPQR